MRTIIATALKRTGRASVRLAAAAALAFAATGGAAELRLATTSTLNDSGLLDALLPAFTRETGLRVKPLVAGTGQTLRMAERGDADLVWSHSPSDEERFVAAGYGTGRSVVMTNAFLLAGP
ncbi:MAG: hypothetical protein GZ089_11170, partial [Aromatoleum sp.]|nr:hypothetical protein [Aromatoleum sp.]